MDDAHSFELKELPFHIDRTCHRTPLADRGMLLKPFSSGRSSRSGNIVQEVIGLRGRSPTNSDGLRKDHTGRSYR